MILAHAIQRILMSSAIVTLLHCWIVRKILTNNKEVGDSGLVGIGDMEVMKKCLEEVNCNWSEVVGERFRTQVFMELVTDPKFGPA